MREQVALVDGFPKDKNTFVWESIQQVAKDKDHLRHVLNEDEDHPDHRANLIEYVRVLTSILRSTISKICSRSAMLSQVYGVI